MSDDKTRLHPDLDPVSQVYGEAIVAMGRKLGFKRGWQSAAARTFGVSRSYISKIVSGERFTVGARAYDRAVERGLIEQYYWGPRGGEQQLPTAREAVVSQWDDLLAIVRPIVAAEVQGDEEAVAAGGVELAKAVLSMRIFRQAERVIEAAEQGDVAKVRRRTSRLVLLVQTYGEALGAAHETTPS